MKYGLRFTLMDGKTTIDIPLVNKIQQDNCFSGLCKCTWSANTFRTENAIINLNSVLMVERYEEN